MLDTLLKLDTIGPNLFQNQTHQQNFRQALFGGQVVGQALAAACATVSGRAPHSLHAYFLRPGTTVEPVTYAVTNVRDGNTVSSREVIATQGGKEIYRMLCSFHAPEQGFEHQLVKPAPNTQPPAELQLSTADKIVPNEQTISEFIGKVPLDYVAYDDLLFSRVANDHAFTRFWFKSKVALTEQSSHYAALAFASDIGLLASSLLPHSTYLFSGEVIGASMDHAIWFHQAPRFDQWHQYETSSTWAGNARALCSGKIFNEQGVLVATVMQEGLIRPISS